MQRLTPTLGQTVSLTERFNGIRHDVYWRVIGLGRYNGHQVELRRHGPGPELGRAYRRMALGKFARKAKVSPDHQAGGRT